MLGGYPDMLGDYPDMLGSRDWIGGRGLGLVVIGLDWWLWVSIGGYRLALVVIG